MGDKRMDQQVASTKPNDVCMHNNVYTDYCELWDRYSIMPEHQNDVFLAPRLGKNLYFVLRNHQL